MNVEIKNPDLSGEEKTYLSQRYSDGTTLNVTNSTGFSDTDHIVVGAVGNDNTESTNITAAPSSSNSLTITALNWAHSKDTIVRFTRWNQYHLQSRANSSASWGDLTTGTDIEWDDMQSTYFDSSGTSATQYRVRFISSAASQNSEWSGTVLGSGYGRKAVGEMIKRVRTLTADPKGRLCFDDDIISYFNDAQQIIEAEIPHAPFLLAEDNTTTTTAGTREYSFPSDMRSLESLRFRYISTTSTSTSTTA